MRKWEKGRKGRREEGKKTNHDVLRLMPCAILHTQYILHFTFYVLRFTRPRFLPLCLLVAVLWVGTPSSVLAHQRFQPRAFDGALHLTRPPRIGGNATLILSVGSNLPETVHARIWFRLPRGISSRSTDLFDDSYFPPYAPNQQYSLRLHVEKPGNYPLQASIYATLPDGQTEIEHFYTYLLVTPSYAQVSPEPFDEPMDHRPLETRVQFRAFRAAAGGLTVRGSVVYFDDNDRMELPIHRPQVLLYLDNPLGKDIEIDQTFANEHGAYIFENPILPELNPGMRRDLYVVVRFDNSVLSIEDRQKKIYEFPSETVRDVPDGEAIIDFALDPENSNRGLAHIFNTIQLAHTFLISRLGWERDRSVRVVWPGTGNISSYFAHQFGDQVSSETIRIVNQDQWRRITMFHEYGHAVMTGAYGYNYDSVPRGNYQGSHRLETVTDTGFAFNEGWAEFMEAAVDNRALNVTGRPNQIVPNIESNQWWTGHVEGKGVNISGERVEGAVASILWDIFDRADSTDHQANVDDDGILDRLDLLWEIFLNDKPQDITAVAIAWRERGFPMLEALEEIYATHHTLSRPNTVPTFRFTSPTADGGLADKSFQITWEASDPDGDDFTITLFYDLNRRSGGSTLIQSRLSSDRSGFTWNTNFIANGKYYLRAEVKDSRNATTEVYSDGFVIVDHTPLLPPIITSNTHPDPNRWYVNNSPQLAFQTQPTVISGQQYSFILNREPETVPDANPDALVRNNKLTLAGLGDGAWWVHIRARDELGYWTDASHFGIKIDSTPPPRVPSPRWLTDPTGNSPEITLEWDAAADVSEIIAYHVQIDVDSRDFQSNLLFDQSVDGNVRRHTFTGVLGKTYYAQIKAENGANLLSRTWSLITPGVMLTEPAAWDLNRDGLVNIIDLVLVASHFGETIAQPAIPNPDVNRDGVVDIADLILVAGHFGEGVNAAVAPGLRISKSRNTHHESRFTSHTSPRIDLARIQTALLALHRHPRPPPNVQAAMEALKSWLEAVLESDLPPVMETRLLLNYPNPFNPETWIPYELAAPAAVRIEIYAGTGQLVRRLDLGRQSVGRYHRPDRAAYWDGRDEAGNAVASGIYFYVLRVSDSSGSHTYTRKMVLSK